ncbi:hypothetical protein BH11MYX4_BH11MYX4_54580 [soil metagenome]
MKFVDKPVRAVGNLVHGSLVRRDSPCEYRFTIEKNGAELPVSFKKCVVPDSAIGTGAFPTWETSDSGHS